MSQFDMFGAEQGVHAQSHPSSALSPIGGPEEMTVDPVEEHLPAADLASPPHVKKGDLDPWIRETQRKYLLLLVSPHWRARFPSSRRVNTAVVLRKLNGLAGEW